MIERGGITDEEREKFGAGRVSESLIRKLTNQYMRGSSATVFSSFPVAGTYGGVLNDTCGSVQPRSRRKSLCGTAGPRAPLLSRRGMFPSKPRDNYTLIRTIRMARIVSHPRRIESHPSTPSAHIWGSDLTSSGQKGGASGSYTIILMYARSKLLPGYLRWDSLGIFSLLYCARLR
jgi:hypothetical protein